MKLVHHGKLNNGKILMPKVTGFHRATNKPAGEYILWTSPLNSVFGWLHWLAKEEMEGKDKDVEGISAQELAYGNCWIIDLSEGAKILRVDAEADLKSLARRYRILGFPYLDWPCIAKNFDLFWLTRKGQKETRCSYPMGLWGYDCETVIIFNTNVISGCAAYP